MLVDVVIKGFTAVFVSLGADKMLSTSTRWLPLLRKLLLEVVLAGWLVGSKLPKGSAYIADD